MKRTTFQYLNTVKNLNRSEQTVQTQIRLFLKEQSDLDIHCLLFHLHFSVDTLLHWKIVLFLGQLWSSFWVSQFLGYIELLWFIELQIRLSFEDNYEMDGWMICDFTSFLSVFQSYQGHGRIILNGCVQWNLIYSWEDSALELGTARSVGQRLTHWATRDAIIMRYFFLFLNRKYVLMPHLGKIILMRDHNRQLLWLPVCLLRQRSPSRMGSNLKENNLLLGEQIDSLKGRFLSWRWQFRPILFFVLFCVVFD